MQKLYGLLLDAGVEHVYLNSLAGVMRIGKDIEVRQDKNRYRIIVGKYGSKEIYGAKKVVDFILKLIKINYLV